MQQNQEKNILFAQKKTNSLINGKGKTNVRRVMETIYGYNRPLLVKEIQKDTGFTQKQVLKSLEFMDNVGMITKSYENLGARHKIPPRRKLKVSLSGSQIKKAKRFLYK